MHSGLDSTVIIQGPVLIGFTFNVVLLGVMISQVYICYTSFRKDSKWLKVFVSILLGLDIFNTACGAAYLYMALIIHNDDALYLNRVTWIFDMDPAITSFIVSMVQSFYAWRIWVLTKSRIFTSLIIITAFTGGVCGILTPIILSQIMPYFTELFEDKIPAVIVLWLASEVIGDILVTIVLAKILSKSKTGFKGTDLLVDRIIRITIQTGLITAIAALTNLIVYITLSSGLHLLFNFVLCKVYSNSLMSTLNSRGEWVSGKTEKHQEFYTLDNRDHAAIQFHVTMPSALLNESIQLHEM